MVYYGHAQSTTHPGINKDSNNIVHACRGYLVFIFVL